MDFEVSKIMKIDTMYDELVLQIQKNLVEFNNILTVNFCL